MQSRVKYLVGDKGFINGRLLKILKAALAVTLSVCLSVPLSWAGAPAQVNYQGKLANAAGNPITNAAQTIRVQIFDQSAGGASVFGPEIHTVSVSNGLFSLPIGSIASGLGTALRGGTDLYLEITIDPGLGSEAVLAPRQRLVAAPYALAVAAESVGTTELSDDAVTGAKIEDGTITNADINAGAAIEASKLTGVLTTGGTRTNANLDTLTAGPASDADALHTHSGLTPADHADTHAPAGTDSLESVYTSLSTDQTISGLKTFNPDAPGVPFALGANAQNQLVTGLNADLLDGQTAADFALSAHNHSAGNITSGILDLTRGGTGADLSATGGANQFVRQSTSGGAFTVSAITDADVPDTITASNYLPLTGGDVNGQLSIIGGNNLCLGGVCESSWPSSGVWTDLIGAIQYDGQVGINKVPAYALDVDGSVNVTASNSLCIDGDCRGFWPWTETVNIPNPGDTGIYFSAGIGNVGIGGLPGTEALTVAGNIAVAGTVDGYDLSVSGPVWDNDLVNDSVEASELTSLFTGSAGLLRKIDADTYDTLGSLSGGTWLTEDNTLTAGHLGTGSVGADEVSAGAVGSSELACSNNNELLRGGTAGCITYDNWDTAFGWGDHSSAGYLTSESQNVFTTIVVEGTDPVAGNPNDTLTLVEGTNIDFDGLTGNRIRIDALFTDTNTNAATICAGGEFLNGDGTCDPVVADTNAGTICDDDAGVVLAGDGTCQDNIVVGGNSDKTINIDYNGSSSTIEATHNNGGRAVYGITKNGGKAIEGWASNGSNAYGLYGWANGASTNYAVYASANSGTSYGIWASGGTYAGYFSGNLHVTGTASRPGGGAWTDSSDKRLKKNIRPLGSTLDRILQLRGVAYEWKKPEEHGNLTGPQIGMIAQEVEKVFPEWISTGNDGYKLMGIRGFEALTVEALRELKKENDELKKEIELLKKAIQKLSK